MRQLRTWEKVTLGIGTPVVIVALGFGAIRSGAGYLSDDCYQNPFDDVCNSTLSHGQIEKAVGFIVRTGVPSPYINSETYEDGERDIIATYSPRYGRKIDLKIHQECEDGELQSTTESRLNKLSWINDQGKSSSTPHWVAEGWRDDTFTTVNFAGCLDDRLSVEGFVVSLELVG